MVTCQPRSSLSALSLRVKAVICFHVHHSNTHVKWGVLAEGLTAMPASQMQVPKPDVVITSFEALVSDAAALKALSWDFVIMDERTRMQSALSRAYQAIYGVHCRARAIVAHSSLLKTVSNLASAPYSVE